MCLIGPLLAAAGICFTTDSVTRPLIGASLDNNAKRLMVSSSSANGSTYAAGLASGDIIVSMDGEPVTSAEMATIFDSLAFAAPSLTAQQRLATPDFPSSLPPGAIATLGVSGSTTNSRDSIVGVTGTVSDEPLHFHRVGHDRWRAIGAISADAKDETRVLVTVEFASGKAESIRRSILTPKPPPHEGSRRALAVDSRFTRPLDAETQARVDRENATAREIGRRSHDRPRQWSEPFILPRQSAITSRFGSGRMFNGTLTSRHLGVDFRGQTGQPIRAANRGVVALVANFFLAGNVAYVDHGEGIVTAYFHMSKTLVAAGDTVERGQEIGLVGATGRVTGPHLHWSARYGAMTVNPLDLTSVGADW